MLYFEDSEKIIAKARHDQDMLLQIRKENIKRIFCGQELAGHRREYIETIDGVSYYDDSRAECVDATWFTLDTIVGPTVWITDGKCNGGHYEDLKDKVSRNVKSIVCIGNDKKIKSLFNENTGSIVKANDIKDAVKKAATLAEAGSLVIFSPTTNTFAGSDIGETFRNEVMGMK